MSDVGEQGQFRAETALGYALARHAREAARAGPALLTLLVSCGGGSGSDGRDWDQLGDVSGGSGDVRPLASGPDAGAPSADAGPREALPVADAPQLMTRLYQGDCDGDARVQWGFLTYTAHTPGDSSITFQIRTANSEAALASEPWSDLMVAQASPDTQSCTFFGPAPCPIDLYVVLGGAPRAHDLFAEIAMLFQQSRADRPTLDSWKINYSCPFSQ
jgi:hypothetical protein